MTAAKLLLWLGLSAAFLVDGALANINFPPPYIECKTSVDQCLRGMECVAELYVFVDASVCLGRNALGFTSTVRYSSLTSNRCKYRSHDNALNRRQPIAWPGPFSSPASVLGRATPGSSEPVINNVKIQDDAAAAGAPTKDGTCGKQKGDTTCVGWPTGECCSMYGWCGNTGKFLYPRRSGVAR
jgi:hypothetical protein